MNRRQVLDTAKNAVLSDRHKNYGDPEDNFQFIADLWNVYVKHVTDIRGGEFTMAPHDEAIHQIFVKVARVGQTPEHMDSWVDIAGYSACGAECVELPIQTVSREEWDTTNQEDQ